MNKRLLMMISLMLLVGLSFIVYALESRVIVDDTWSMIYGFSSLNNIIRGDAGTDNFPPLSKENVKAIYILLPLSQKYARVYPDPETTKIYNEISETDLKQSVMFVFTDKRGSLKLDVVQPIQLNERKIYRGWNFVPITEDMLNLEPRAIAGSCNILKSYYYDADEGQWIQIPLTTKFSQISRDALAQEIGYNWVIKVTEDCRLGFPSIPSLPT